MTDLLTVTAVAGTAAAASLVGGVLSLWWRPSTLFMSVAFGLAAGALIGTISLEMIPRALELGDVPMAIAGFAVGFAAVYGFDLFVYRGELVGEHAEQRPLVEERRRRRPPRAGESAVLAGGTSAEEVIEGITIGIGTAIQPTLAVLIALAVAVDNLGEGLSIGEMVQKENQTDEPPTSAILGWTGTIAVSLFVSAVVGWLVLRGLPAPVLAILLGTGAGGMLYLTLTDLVPEGQARQFQQSSALAAGAAFAIIMVLTQLMRGA